MIVRNLTALALAVVAGTCPALAQPADTVFRNGRVVTLDAKSTVATGLALTGERIAAVGDDAALKAVTGPSTRVIDLGGRTVIPGLIDSHLHAIRAGLTYTIEVDWSAVTTLAAGLAKISDAAKKRPGAWVLLPGGWHETQLAEARGPTPDELAKAAPDNPVYVQHLYDYAVLNPKGMATLALAKDSKVPPNGKLELDANGEPTGIIRGDLPTFSVLFGKLSTISYDAQLAGTRAFFNQLAASGLTGVIDAGGGGVGPEQMKPVLELWKKEELPIRLSYYVNSLKPGQEFVDLKAMLDTPAPNDEHVSRLGIGEVVVWGIHDGTLAQAKSFVPKPGSAEALKEIATWAATNKHGLQIHASSNAAAKLLLDIFEDVAKTEPVKDLRWVLAHIEDASKETLNRMKALGMIWAVQDRLLFEGDSWPRIVGAETAKRAPPIKDGLEAGLVIAAGTDGTRSAPYNPFVTLQWLVTGRSITGKPVRGPEQSPTREQALRMHTIGSATMAGDEKERGTLEVGKLADLVVLSEDYFAAPEDRIAKIMPMLTLVGGNVAFAAEPFMSIPKAGKSGASGHKH